jgi:hypothetical protein
MIQIEKLAFIVYIFKPISMNERFKLTIAHVTNQFHWLIDIFVVLVELSSTKLLKQFSRQYVDFDENRWTYTTLAWDQLDNILCANFSWPVPFSAKVDLRFKF